MRASAVILFMASASLLAVGLVGAGAGAGAPSPADLEKGREIYERCGACHSLERDRVGPRHCGLFGRRAGGVPGFAYSEAMRKSGIVWDREALDRFLTSPLDAVPGTFMTYAGVSDPEERAQLLAYLEVATRGKGCSPSAVGGRP